MSMHDEGVVDRIERLPIRFRGPAPFPARFRLEVGPVVRDVVIGGDDCHVEMPQGRPDAEITTDPVTWSAIDDGLMSGIEAFARRRLNVRGSIEKSLYFEPAFERAHAGGMRYSISRVRTKRATVSALSAGDPHAEPLVLVHGLGATKASWLPVVPELAARYRVISLDLPGFGASSKPWGRYDAAWFAGHVFDVLDELGYGRALVAGNSMGGRIAQEMAMLRPERVKAIACLCPATAFSHRPMLLIARLARAELGMMVSRLPRSRIKEATKQMFADSRRVDDEWFDAAVDDFLTVWRSPRARMAFFAAARNIYIDEPDGDAGFWARLSQMTPRALYVFGSQDYLISSKFGKLVTGALPSAHVEVWRDCGHVPQIEFPEKTARSLLDFFETVPARTKRTAAV